MTIVNYDTPSYERRLILDAYSPSVWIALYTDTQQYQTNRPISDRMSVMNCPSVIWL